MDRGDPIYLASDGPPLTEEDLMTNESKPLGPYDPSEEDLAKAAATLAEFGHHDEFTVHFVVGWVSGELDSIADGRGKVPATGVRRARAMFAAYHARRDAHSAELRAATEAALRKAVES